MQRKYDTMYLKKKDYLHINLLLIWINFHFIKSRFNRLVRYIQSQYIWSLSICLSVYFEVYRPKGDATISYFSQFAW